MKKLISAVAALLLMVSMLAGCNTNNNSSSGGNNNSASGTDTSGTATVDTSTPVNVVMYLYGSEGVKNPEILAALNEKLKADINTTLEIKYMDWGDVATKYPLLWAAGEQFDMAYVASGATVPYATLVRQDALVDITDMLNTAAPKLKAALADNVWKSVEVDGKIYGVPSDYSEFTAQGFVSNKALMDKYKVSSIKSIADMEAYMDAAAADGMVPLNGNTAMAYDLYRMFIATTGDWIDAPGLPNGAALTLAGTVADAKDIFSPVFTEEFADYVVKMREWADKGYWSKDILSASQGAKDNFNNGLSAAFLDHQPGWTGNYGAMKEKLGDVGTEFYCFAEEHNKIVRKAGVENATGISVNSKNPERALMVIEKLMTDEECYRLFQYGTSEQFEFVDGVAKRPEGFNDETMGGGFAGWAMRTDALNVPYETEDPRRYTLNEEWKKVAIDNPYVGFSFDTSDYSAELSAISNVDSQLGIQLMLGKTTEDPLVALEQYRAQLKTAGIDTIVEAVKAQYAAYLAG